MVLRPLAMVTTHDNTTLTKVKYSSKTTVGEKMNQMQQQIIEWLANGETGGKQ